MVRPQITMAKEEGVRTVVVGGKSDLQQHYCGIVGGQSTDFSTIDTEIKVRQIARVQPHLSEILAAVVDEIERPSAIAARFVGLVSVVVHAQLTTIWKHHSLTNSIQGITWRLGYGINDPTEPEGTLVVCRWTSSV
jgi:hypothetical protein